ncbi:MAG TPA: ABC transporter ATP-binding protein [Candidatus Lustribacter sp.]|nr:ABC transporter ATP-binding protein [Candidatus Lustribacter sp.]
MSAPGTTGGVAVALTHLTREYAGGIRALDDFTLHIQPGEFVALLGPSGCGKTTALRCLAGLEDPNSGTVEVGGTDLTSVPTNKRDMGMVFQAYSLFPHMTARQNVEFGLQLRKRSAEARRARTEEMLALVGLEAQADRYAHQMSGGQQQRVALARALAIEPQVLLLDEPLSALDAKVRTQLRDEIRRIQLEVGTTTLFVTHDQEEALAVADRVGVMRAGTLEQLAPPQELYARPATAFVADFVGLTNRLKGVSAGSHAQVLGVSIPLLPGSATSGPVEVLVRPEAIGVAPDDGGQASVVSASFLGAHGRVIATTDFGERVVVQVSSSAVTSYPPGSRVRLTPSDNPALAVATG